MNVDHRRALLVTPRAARDRRGEDLATPPSSEDPLGIPGFRHITYFEDGNRPRAAMATDELSRADEATVSEFQIDKYDLGTPMAMHLMMGLWVFMLIIFLFLSAALFADLPLDSFDPRLVVGPAVLAAVIVVFAVNVRNARKKRRRAREHRQALDRVCQFTVPLGPPESGAVGLLACGAAGRYAEAKAAMLWWPDLRRQLPDVPALAASALEEHLAQGRADSKAALESELRHVEKLLSCLADDSAELVALRGRRDELAARVEQAGDARGELEEADIQVERLMAKARAREYLAHERG